jgi:hypothetical protein
MDIFSLQIQVAGFNRHASARSDGTGITIETDAGPRRARTVREAIREARGYLGPFLHEADRRKLPWGILVSAGGVSAVYGECPLLGGGGGGSVSIELVTRIRREYHDGAGALAALENALRIIDAYTDNRRAAA